MSVLNGADALLIMTGWREFRQLDAAELKERMRQPLIFDNRNLYDRDALARQGVEYHGVARAPDADSDEQTFLAK